MNLKEEYAANDAVAIALSVKVGKKTMDECLNKIAPSFIAHLKELGYKVVRK